MKQTWSTAVTVLPNQSSEMIEIILTNSGTTTPFRVQIFRMYVVAFERTGVLDPYGKFSYRKPLQDGQYRLRAIASTKVPFGVSFTGTSFEDKCESVNEDSPFLSRPFEISTRRAKFSVLNKQVSVVVWSVSKHKAFFKVQILQGYGEEGNVIVYKFFNV